MLVQAVCVVSCLNSYIFGFKLLNLNNRLSMVFLTIIVSFILGNLLGKSHDLVMGFDSQKWISRAACGSTWLQFQDLGGLDRKITSSKQPGLPCETLSQCLYTIQCFFCVCVQANLKRHFRFECRHSSKANCDVRAGCAVAHL